MPSLKKYIFLIIYVLSFLFVGNVYAEEISIPIGVIEGESRSFNITNSDYLNVSLESSEIISLKMESRPSMVTLLLKQGSTTLATSTQVVLSGFLPNTTYYKYEDGYHNLLQFTTDNNGGYSYVQDITVPHIAFIQTRRSTKFIKDDLTGGDCSSIGTWDLSTKTCVLNLDLYETIQIDSDNVTLDGNNHLVEGTYTGSGIYINGKSGVTIKNIRINNFYYSLFLVSVTNSVIDHNTLVKLGIKNGSGVYLVGSNNNVISNNLVSSNGNDGIVLGNSSFNQIKNNTTNENNSGIYIGDNSSTNIVTANSASGNSCGICLSLSVGNTLSNNNLTANQWGLYVYNSSLNAISGNSLTGNTRNFFLNGGLNDHFNNTIDTSNLLDGKPLYYIKNAVNQVYDNALNAGSLYCIDCKNVTVRNIDFANAGAAVYFWQTYDSRVENINVLNSDIGVYLKSSDRNTLNSINSSAHHGAGVFLLYSRNNKLENSMLSGGVSYGISVSGSENNEIVNNQIVSNGVIGIYVGNYSMYNNVHGNNIVNNTYGISNSYNFNNFYNNNLINNTYPLTSTGWSTFDLSLPIGGNYLSNFDEAVEGCNDANNDNLCDSPYIFFRGQDNLPWTKPNGWVPNQAPTISGLKQSKSDGATAILEGGITTESSVNDPTKSLVMFGAAASDADGDQVKIQVELKEVTQSFDGQNLVESSFVSSGSEASTTKDLLVNGIYKWRARAVDSKGAVSDWQEFGVAGNIDVEVKLVPLYTQVLSSYPVRSAQEEWANLDYAGGLSGNYSCGSKISECGCAVTSMVMLGRYYGINGAVNSTDVNPGNINTWLNGSMGYTVSGDLIWAKGVEYLGVDDNGIKKSKLSFDYHNTTNRVLIDSYVDTAKPAIVFDDIHGHYFVVDGKLKTGPGANDQTYTLKDPYWYNTRILNQVADIPNHIQGYGNHFQKANLFSYSDIPQQISAALYIYLASPAELLITDPLGRRLGKDPVSGVSYNEIPNGSYTYDEAVASSELPLALNSSHKTKVVYIKTGAVGDYQIKVTGTGSGAYTVGTVLYDNQGTSHAKTLTGTTQTNRVTDYTVHFTPDTPAAIDFKLTDVVPPVISHTSVSAQYLVNSLPLTFEFSATDTESGVANISAKLDGVAIPSGSSIALNQVGLHKIEITAQDVVGNIATEIIEYNVVYSFSGFLQPIKVDSSGVYRLGRTLPVKFQLTDSNNAYISNAVTQLLVAKISDGVVGTDEVPLSTNGADSGSVFRYDTTSSQYIYNLSTDSLGVGSWQLKTVLNDGKVYTVVISVR